MADFLKSYFVQNLKDDDREPILEFTIPHVGGEYSLYAPTAESWNLLFLTILVGSTIQIAFSCFIYEAIVKRRGTLGSYLVGWGFIIPLSFVVPFYLLEVLDIRNKVFCLTSATPMSILCFRCLEAMYGTSPNVTESSIWNYCCYYSNMAPYVWSTKARGIEKTSGTIFFNSFIERLFNFVALSLVLSFLMHFDFEPFEDRIALTGFNVSRDLFSLGHLYNSYLFTVLLYFTLNNLFELNAFGENVKGFATQKVFDSPLTKSKTPTEFWTERWNHMTHLLLKRGIFEPAKKCFHDRRIAMFVTFVVSGLYHEYCWACIFYDQSYLYDSDGKCLKDEGCYDFQFGRVTAFFAYTGIVMLLERPLRKLALVKWFSSVLPTVVVAQLLVLIHVPFVKWYCGDWIKGGFFDDLSMMTFLIRKV